MKLSCQDATFFIDYTRLDNTGNYSCVFSVHKYNPEAVKGKGINSIFITVNGKIFNWVVYCFFLFFTCKIL